VLSVAQAAHLLGLSRSNTYAHVRDGTIPSVRIGRRVLVPKQALERLLGVTITAGTPTDRKPPGAAG
jgi:excisionase family DNA binding protein